MSFVIKIAPEGQPRPPPHHRSGGICDADWLSAGTRTAAPVGEGDRVQADPLLAGVNGEDRQALSRPDQWRDRRSTKLDPAPESLRPVRGLQLNSHPIEISPVGRNDTIGHVKRSAAESKYLA